MTRRQGAELANNALLTDVALATLGSTRQNASRWADKVETMGTVDIRVNSVRLFLHTAQLDPLFASRPVLSPDPFAYVRLKMQRDRQLNALVYWRQAEEFYRASASLSAAASPLTSYYCMLNAAKALLTVKAHPHSDFHGLTGAHSGPVSLQGETVVVSKGVFPALAALYGAQVQPGDRFSLRDLLGEIPFVHRSFTLTYTSAPELFVPLESPRFVRKDVGTEAWFAAIVPPSYESSSFRLPKGFERDLGDPKVCRIRLKKRFKWDEDDVTNSLVRFTTYHARVHAEVSPIITTGMNRWYLRKEKSRGPAFRLPLLARMFAAMHRLSELSRYNPVRLERHLEAKHNWLLDEFLAQAPAQFVHLVARELARREFIHPDAARVPSP